MLRQARIDTPGALHHIMVRGIERKENRHILTSSEPVCWKRGKNRKRDGAWSVITVNFWTYRRPLCLTGWIWEFWADIALERDREKWPGAGAGKHYDIPFSSFQNHRFLPFINEQLPVAILCVQQSTFFASHCHCACHDGIWPFNP